jgi:hypothetical protein
MYPVDVSQLNLPHKPNAAHKTHHASRVREGLVSSLDLGKDIGQRPAMELDTCNSTLAVLSIQIDIAG